jgi:hypothetical protein
MIKILVSLTLFVFAGYSSASLLDTLKTTLIPEPEIKVLLLIPQGVIELNGVEEKVENSITTAQKWYAKQLGGRTFKLSTQKIKKISIQEPISKFANEETRKSYSAKICYRVAQKYAPIKVDDPGTLWVVFIAGGEFIAHGGRGFSCTSTDPFYAVRERKDINTKTGFDSIVAHEIGHAMGLKHPEDWFNDRSLMGRWGGVLFPDETHFLDSDKKILLNSPFIRGIQNLR